MSSDEKRLCGVLGEKNVILHINCSNYKKIVFVLYIKYVYLIYDAKNYLKPRCLIKQNILI